MATPSLLLKKLCSSALLLAPLFIWAQTVTIKGVANGYTQPNIAAFVQADPLSGKKEMLQQVALGKDGSFVFTLTVNETTPITIAIGQIEGLLFVEPDKTYDIDFPAYSAAEIKRFDKTEITLGLKNASDGELNILIRAFNRDYAKFLDDHFYDFAIDQYKGSESYQAKQLQKGSKSDMIPRDTAQLISVSISNFGKILDTFDDEVHAKYQAHYSNQYFFNYVRYSLAELDLMGGSSRKELYKEYFMSQKVLWKNPAYMHFFEEYYNLLLTTQKKDIQDQVYAAVNAQKSYTALTELFAYDSTLISLPMRELALIKGLRDIYYNSSFVKNSVSATLESFVQNGSDALTKRTAVNVREKFLRCKSNWPLEDFTLLDEENELWSSAEHEHKYVYYVFFANWSPSSLTELQMLQRWYEKYNKDIHFVAICMDNDYNAFKSYLAKHRDQKFTFLYGGGDFLLREKFDLRTVPHAVLMNTEGKVVGDYTRRPTEGIQMDFEKIVNQKAKASGTWKD